MSLVFLSTGLHKRQAAHCVPALLYGANNGPAVVDLAGWEVSSSGRSGRLTVGPVEVDIVFMDPVGIDQTVHT